MSTWVLLAGFYLWLGFTVGYFFRKWMEVSFLPAVEESRARPPAAVPGNGLPGNGLPGERTAGGKEQAP